MHVAIRADGGPSIGYGHLVRTGALADRVIDGGGRVTYTTRTPRAARTVVPDSAEVVGLAEEEERASFLEWLSVHEPEVVLTDSYEVDTEYQRDIARQVPRLAVVLDDARFTVRADVLINGNVTASGYDYSWVGPEPSWCLGTDFLLLRENIRTLASEDRPFEERPERALITMGGSDIQGATPGVVRAFDGTSLRVDVIVGPGFDNRAEIDRAVAESDAEFDVVENPGDLARRMFDADLAVSATGSTIYELLALGTPTIGLPQADNQEPIAETLDARGSLLTVDGETEDLDEVVQSLVDDPGMRRDLKERGESLVDCQGVDRVYGVVTGDTS